MELRRPPAPGPRSGGRGGSNCQLPTAEGPVKSGSRGRPDADIDGDRSACRARAAAEARAPHHSSPCALMGPDGPTSRQRRLEPPACTEKHSSYAPAAERGSYRGDAARRRRRRNYSIIPLYIYILGPPEFHIALGIDSTFLLIQHAQRALNELELNVDDNIGTHVYVRCAMRVIGTSRARRGGWRPLARLATSESQRLATATVRPTADCGGCDDCDQ
eukprot:scaffold1782_cov123-Isochrysis_galbana.AAC.2